SATVLLVLVLVDVVPGATAVVVVTQVGSASTVRSSARVALALTIRPPSTMPTAPQVNRNLSPTTCSFVGLATPDHDTRGVFPATAVLLASQAVSGRPTLSVVMPVYNEAANL